MIKKRNNKICFFFDEVENLGYLREDPKNGRLTDYQIVFDVDDQNKIIRKRSFLTYSKSGLLEFNNDSVPDLKVLLNQKLIAKQKNIKLETEKIEAEKSQLTEKLNEMYNSDFWNEFDPIVKERIYYLIQDKDCNGLQKEFDNSAEMMDKKQNSGMSGSKHLELMSFLETKMTKLNCHI